MEALHQANGAEFEIFTTAPRWFFEESLSGLFNYHEVACDVGFRQASALVVDIPATVAALDDMLPFDARQVQALADVVTVSGCSAVLCDIAPMGIAVAERAGVPSVLLENFTWYWLYEPYWDEVPELARFSAELAAWRARATVLVQTEPLCEREPAAVFVDPISREPRTDPARTREALGVGREQKVVVITMGGYGEDMSFLDALRARPEITFLITGAHETERVENLRLFSNRAPIFMPDLLRAADAVVAKIGYGMVAEVWREGIPFGFVSRADFREMPPLEAFINRELQGFEIAPEAFAQGAWIERLDELLQMPRTPRSGGGAGAVAALLAGLLQQSASRR